MKYTSNYDNLSNLKVYLMRMSLHYKRSNSSNEYSNSSYNKAYTNYYTRSKKKKQTSLYYITNKTIGKFTP
jgi:hypothetical protein